MISFAIIFMMLISLGFIKNTVSAGTPSGKIDVLVRACEIKYDPNETSKIKAVNEVYDAKIKKKKLKQKRKWEKIKAMSLNELNDKGYIEKLCKKYGMSKLWFDRISTTESGYGRVQPDGSYNGWGWGIYGNKVTKLGDNWYDSSEVFISSFVEKYGESPSKSGMRRYCPSGAYDKYF